MQWWIAFKYMLDPFSIRDGIYYAAAHCNIRMLESYALFLQQHQSLKLDNATFEWIVTCNYHAKSLLSQYALQLW